MEQVEKAAHPLQKWLHGTLLLIALVTPLFVNFWVEQQFEASKVWLLRLLVCMLIYLWLVNWLSGLYPQRLPAAIRNLSVALSLVLILSTLLSTNQTIATFGSLDRAHGVLTQLCYLLLFFCAATQLTAPTSRELIRVIIITAVPICLMGLAQAAGWQPLPVFTDARSLVITTLGRPNFTGAYLALLLPLTVTAARFGKNNWQRGGYGALTILQLVVIGLTQARAAWIAAVVGMGVLFWLHLASSKSRQFRWFSALGGVAFWCGALLLILQRGIAAGGSIAARWTIWQTSLRLLWPRLWLGYGADTLALHFPAVYPPQLVYYQGRGVVVDRAHNWLLDWSLNYGIVAALIFLALVGLVLRLGWQQITTAPLTAQPEGKPRLAAHWIAACMAAVCAQLAGNLFLFEVAATAVVFWLLLAVVIAAAAPHGRQAAPKILPLWQRVALMVIAALVLTGVVWVGSVRPLLADVHSWRGTRALGQQNPLAALAEYETAVTFQPYRASYHVAAALTAAQLGRFEQAEKAMREAIGLHPTDPVLHTQLAAIYGREADFQTEAPEYIRLAYDTYKQAIALAPTIALTYQQYADLALRWGDKATALAQAQRAVDLDATDGIAFGILGWAQLQAGDLAAAQSAFEQAVKWQPAVADFHLGLATVYAQQGRFDAARQAVQRSLLLDPAYAPALTLQVQLQDR